jgi:catechol 2,3-dioxygenase-like lactoylglutathione lyase family enzyme
VRSNVNFLRRHGCFIDYPECVCLNLPKSAGAGTIARSVSKDRRSEDRTMKRLHVHVAVDDLAKSIGFYSTLFAAEPTVVKPDYAKWMLEDPRVNFAISTHGDKPGLDHLGIQVESDAELSEVYGRLKRAEGPVLEEGATTCCYAQSDKSWIIDPQGLAWETFHTTGESTVYGYGASEQLQAMKSACCGDALTEVIAATPARAGACCGD